MADAPDALDQAQAQISAQKAATLAAIAKAGSQGAQQYQAALAGNTAAKTAALQGQLASLGAVSAPVAFTSQEQAKLSQPFDLASANLASQGQARQDFLSNLGASSGTYFDQANAAVPAMRAAAHNALLNANEKLMAAAQSQNAALQLKELEIQAAQAKLNPAATVAGALSSLGSTAGEQGANLYGIGQDQNTADQAAQAAAMQNITPNPLGLAAAGVSAALPTVDTSNPGVVSGFTGGLGTPWAPGATTPINVPAPDYASSAAAVQALNQRLAELGASGAPGFVPGEASNAAGGSGGVPNISPALADQIYNASSQGIADQKAVTAAAATPTENAQVQAMRAIPAYQKAASDYVKTLAAVGQKGGPPSLAAADAALIAAVTNAGGNMDWVRQIMADYGRAASAYQAPTPVTG